MTRSRYRPRSLMRGRPGSFRLTRRLAHGSVRTKVRVALASLDGERASAPAPRHSCLWDLW